MDRLATLQAFVAVADAKGFSAAARRLGWSAPAVTRAIADLEAHLSIRLLQRTTRSVSLTDAGARFLDRSRRILADLEEAERAARAERTEPTGRLVVAAPKVFGRRHVAPLLADLLERYPAVSAELTLADRLVNLIEEGVDVAVRIGTLEDSTLRARPAGSTRRVVVASPAYLERHRTLRSPRDIAGLPAIQFAPLAGAEWRFYRRGVEQRVRVEPQLVTNDAEVAILHAVRGVGLAMVLAYQVIDLVRAGALRVVLPKFEPPPQPIHLVHPAGRLPPAHVRAFIDLALATRDWRFLEL
jgi:DNA-binding transcriptional LysR family regulator